MVCRIERSCMLVDGLNLVKKLSRKGSSCMSKKKGACTAHGHKAN